MARRGTGACRECLGTGPQDTTQNRVRDGLQELVSFPFALFTLLRKCSADGTLQIKVQHHANCKMSQSKDCPVGELARLVLHVKQDSA